VGRPWPTRPGASRASGPLAGPVRLRAPCGTRPAPWSLRRFFCWQAQGQVAGLAKRDISPPVSAPKTSAAPRATPGMVFRCRKAVRKGPRCGRRPPGPKRRCWHPGGRRGPRWSRPRRRGGHPSGQPRPRLRGAILSRSLPGAMVASTAGSLSLASLLFNQLGRYGVQSARGATHNFSL
jgi:hypothetical protein